MPQFRSSSDPKIPLHTLDVRRDDSDARDYVFQPSLTLLPAKIDNRGHARILDQRAEGACAGFALATVINVSLSRRGAPAASRRRRAKPPGTSVSPRMLYEMGRRYDEWAGESYEGTSLRGAMKGWHKHGVADDSIWPYYRVQDNGEEVADRRLTPERATDALRRPIGAYYRIDDCDVGHLQAAVCEADTVLASAWVHAGWQHENLERRRGLLPAVSRRSSSAGLHAFAIVGYTRDGFIIQNSWGTKWGSDGCALLPYDEWFENRQDAWAARPGPETRDAEGAARIFTVGFGGGPQEARAATAAAGLGVDARVLPYLVNTGDAGALSSEGQLGTLKDELPAMAQLVLTAPPLKDGGRHVVLYAHGGLNAEHSSAVNASRLWSLGEGRLRAYFFIWESGIEESVLGWLKSDDDATGPARFSWQDAWETIQHGASDAVKQAQRALGTGLAPVVRNVFWNEMKGRAEGASQSNGGGALFIEQLFQAMKSTPANSYKLHLVGHSAGSIYLGFLYRNAISSRLATAPNVTLASVQMLAPAITIPQAGKLFVVDEKPAVPPSQFRVYNLASRDEERDSIQIYPSSLLTYVADHLENGGSRVPILGIRSDFDAERVAFATQLPATKSVKHGEFDDRGHEVEQIFADLAKAVY